MIGRYSRYNSVWWHTFCGMVASTFGMMENIFSGTMVGASESRLSCSIVVAGGSAIIVKIDIYICYVTNYI